MIEITRERLRDSLCELDLETGDRVFVHSSLGLIFGRTENPAELLYETLREVVGREGTIAVPTFTFGPCKTGYFHHTKTPSETGVFSELVRRKNGSLRSFHPIHSVAANGPLAREIACETQTTNFSEDSPFGTMLTRDFKHLLVGVNSRAITFSHYIEERFSVPYRAYKDFNITVESDSGKKTGVYKYFVRPDGTNFRANVELRERVLTEEGILRYQRLGWGKIGVCSFRDYFDCFAPRYQETPYEMIVQEKA